MSSIKRLDAPFLCLEITNIRSLLVPCPSSFTPRTPFFFLRTPFLTNLSKDLFPSTLHHITRVLVTSQLLSYARISCSLLVYCLPQLLGCKKARTSPVSLLLYADSFCLPRGRCASIIPWNNNAQKGAFYSWILTVLFFSSTWAPIVKFLALFGVSPFFA